MSFAEINEEMQEQETKEFYDLMIDHLKEILNDISQDLIFNHLSKREMHYCIELIDIFLKNLTQVHRKVYRVNALEFDSYKILKTSLDKILENAN